MNERDIFIAALQIDDNTQRVAYLDIACAGDMGLRHRVEALMGALHQAGSYLEQPAVEPVATIDQPISEQPGDSIGPYKLLQQIGEGGMGVVYMAEQADPVERRVALKVIKPGMDSRKVIARFEAERQALAMMDHPNIAKVLDAGTTETGRPYFVMELVKGEAITEYCDEAKLNPRERLELFIPVCQAVQHAHQKGIIHRDIKPSNVLVAKYDDRPVPKIIDFGVAKAIEQRLTEKSVFTEFGQVVGTVEYMSPEQAQFNQLDIDTRTDVYSLGVLLYELLVGETPFDPLRMRSAAFDEMLRIIREEDPPRPSLRLSTSESRVSIAASRQVEPKKLSTLVHGELDWIVMKALEKDRNRRYETANGLAQDVHRYLVDEPIQACPPSTAYKFRKFARRNWRVVATVSLITFSLVLATIISLSHAHQARVDRQLALQKADEANRSAEAARSEAAKSDAVVRLLRDMLNSANPNAAKGANYTVRELLDDATQRLERQLDDQPEIEATLRQIIGSAYAELRLYDRAELELQRSLHLYRELFGEDDIRLADILLKLARHRWLQKSGDDVERFAREALGIYHRHGDVAGELGARNDLFMNAWGQFRLEDAERMADESLAFARSHNLENDPAFPTILHNLSFLKLAKGDTATAQRLAREAVDKHPPGTSSSGWASFYLGLALRNDSHLAEAEASFRKSLSIWRRLFPTSDEKTVGRAVVELRDALEAQGNAGELAKLEQEYPNELMASHYDFAAIADALMHDPVRAMARWRKAIELAPIANSYERLAWFLASPSDVNLQDASEAVGLAGKAVEFAPADANSWNTLGMARYRAGDWNGAISALRKSRELRTSDAESSNAFLLAMAHWQLGEKDQARERYDQAMKWTEKHQPTDFGLFQFRAEAAELLGVDQSPPPPDLQLQEK